MVRFIIFDVLSRPLFEDLTHVFALAHAQSKKVLINLLHVIPQLLGPRNHRVSHRALINRRVVIPRGVAFFQVVGGVQNIYLNFVCCLPVVDGGLPWSRVALGLVIQVRFGEILDVIRYLNVSEFSLKHGQLLGQESDGVI